MGKEEDIPEEDIPEEDIPEEEIPEEEIKERKTSYSMPSSSSYRPSSSSNKPKNEELKWPSFFNDYEDDSSRRRGYTRRRRRSTRSDGTAGCIFVASIILGIVYYIISSSINAIIRYLQGIGIIT